MKFIKKWFEAFAYLAGFNLMYSLVSNEMIISQSLIILLLIISGVFAIIPDRIFENIKLQLNKDM
jgi:hypothetical protein